MTQAMISVAWIRSVLKGLSPRDRKKNQLKKRDNGFVDM
jgi:hypothetical protein